VLHQWKDLLKKKKKTVSSVAKSAHTVISSRKENIAAGTLASSRYFCKVRLMERLCREYGEPEDHGGDD